MHKNSMNILIDYHHGGLYKSLYLLFEKRLGYKAYRPIGMDWFSRGFFRVAEPYGNPEDTIGQYLGINDKPWDSKKNLNGDYLLEEGVYNIYDRENHIDHRAVTFQKFTQMRFDIILASHPLHDNWRELLTWQPQSRFIMQLGNENQTTNAHKVLSSVWNYQPKDGQDVMYYHQEFDLNEWKYIPPNNHNRILDVAITQEEPETFQIYKSNLPEFIFHKKEDMTRSLVEEMQSSAFGFHIKSWDGYGYVIHNWFALGRPLITRGSYYEGKTGGFLLEDGVTCIDLDKHTFQENLDLIKYWSKPSNHKQMCENVYKKFKEVVDFDCEAKVIKEWI